LCRTHQKTHTAGRKLHFLFWFSLAERVDPLVSLRVSAGRVTELAPWLILIAACAGNPGGGGANVGDANAGGDADLPDLGPVSEMAAGSY